MQTYTHAKWSDYGRRSMLLTCSSRSPCGAVSSGPQCVQPVHSRPRTVELIIKRLWGMPILCPCTINCVRLRDQIIRAVTLLAAVVWPTAWRARAAIKLPPSVLHIFNPCVSPSQESFVFLPHLIIFIHILGPSTARRSFSSHSPLPLWGLDSQASLYLFIALPVRHGARAR
jgi:hypothetical protein